MFGSVAQPPRLELPATPLGKALPAACLLFAALLSDGARADWNIATDARWRHDSNVGNAGNAADVVADSIVAARASIAQIFPVADGTSFAVGADLSGEHYNRLDGLSNASFGGNFALRRKWGLGAFVPWIRLGGSITRVEFNDGYRNAWAYRASLSGGRRWNPAWNLVIDAALERRSTASLAAEAPGISGDSFSQTAESVNTTLQYSFRDNMYVTAGVMLRHGDVVSTTLNELPQFKNVRAYSDDLTFGPEAYAYRRIGNSVAGKLSINVVPAPHHLLGVAFQRFETRTDGGGRYTKSIPELRWDYSF